MDFIFEFLAELLLEGSVEVSSNKKISKFIRYPIILLLILFFLVIIFGLIYIGIKSFNKSKIGSIIIILTGVILLIGSIYKFKKIYLERK